MEILLNSIGWLMIWFMVDYKRKGESIIKAFSVDHFIQIIIVIAGILLTHIR